MSKYKTVTIYYEGKPPVGDGALGKYVNDLFKSGIHAIQILKQAPPHTDHSHDQAEPPEKEYTNIQGNVGSS